MKKQSNKVKDTGEDISFRSRLDRYYQANGFTDEYLSLRIPILNESAIMGKDKDPYSRIIKYHKLRGIEFGNWVNNDARNSYIIASIIALLDLQSVTGFKGLGFGKLGLAFGARGGGGARGHFEPGTWVINLTRYSKGSFLGESGGLGALAHEYGHFIDYFFGTYHNDKSRYRSLTLGRTTAQEIIPEITDRKKTMQGLACAIVETCFGTPYYNKLKQNFAGNEYWFRHNEIFARCFEQFVQRKLVRKGIKNIFLVESKYDNAAYPDRDLAKKLEPLFTRLLAMMKAKV
jgi:Large polyvalent protein-associated domain 1